MARNAKAAMEENRRKQFAAAAVGNWTDERLLEKDAVASISRSYAIETPAAADLVDREIAKRRLKK